MAYHWINAPHVLLRHLKSLRAILLEYGQSAEVLASWQFINSFQIYLQFIHIVVWVHYFFFCWTTKNDVEVEQAQRCFVNERNDNKSIVEGSNEFSTVFATNKQIKAQLEVIKLGRPTSQPVVQSALLLPATGLRCLKVPALTYFEVVIWIYFLVFCFDFFLFRLWFIFTFFFWFRRKTWKQMPSSLI